MTGIFGWVGKYLPSETRASLAPFFQGASQTAGCSTPTASTLVVERPEAILGATHPRGIVDVADVHGYLVAIEGFFWFETGFGQTQDPKGPAHRLIDAFRTFGTEALEKLNGAFSLAIWNSAKRELLLATDRFGMRPVTYEVTPEWIAFAENATALRTFSGVTSVLDPQAIFDYLYFSAIPSPFTIYRDIRRLGPAQYLIWRDGQIRIAHYWLPHFASAADASPGPAELLTVLQEAVSRCDPGRSAGAFLSGGLDSSTVAGLLSRHHENPAPTFTIGFAAEGYNEIDYARIAARHFGNKPHEYYVTPQDVAETIGRIARTYDEPFGNSSSVPTYHCARVAAENGISIMLAGDGGDEIFAGNERYAKQKVFETYFQIPHILRAAVVEPIISRFPFGELLFPVRKLRRYIEQAHVPLPDRLQTYNFLNLSPLSEIFTPEFLEKIDPKRPVNLLRDEYRRIDGDALSRMLYLDWKFTLADNDLRKVTAMCQHAGVEVRYPMLNNNVVDIATRVPTTVLMPRFKLRDYYRKSMHGFLPEAILTKHKHGFGLPFGVWLATSPDLRAIVDEAFSGIRRRGILQQGYLENLLQRHRSEHAGFYGTMVWMIVVLETWLAVNSL
jgi:asparagine synthase (glutamine-hydrolysing)